MDSINYRCHIADTYIRQAEDELVSPKAGGKIAITNAALKDFANANQGFVANSMPIGVVDVLEVVQVNKNECYA